LSEQQSPRIFKTGATPIVEDETMTGLSNEEVRQILARTYPEVAHATLREREAVTEMIAYTGRCTAAAQRLSNLTPVPLLHVAISEFGL
jgi:predicted Zn-dependent protease